MNLRRSSFSSALSNNNSNLYGGFGFKSSQNAYNYSLHPQLLLNTSNNMMVAIGGSIPATSLISLYSSLPPIPLHQQPPLLPLPMKSATMPSPTPPSAIRRSSSTAARQSNQKRKKKQQQQAKPSTGPKKEPAAGTAEEATKPMENKPTIIAAKKEEVEVETEEEFLIGSATASKPVSSVYSLSPPPSSLPLPRLLLMRPRRSAKVAAVASSCIAEAKAGVVAGATDDLRKLLRL